MQSHQLQALPADPYNPNPMAFVHGLPNDPPFIPNIPWAPRIASYAQLITGHALLEAQNNAGKNPLRTFYYNLVSANGYNNQDFIELVGATAELTNFEVIMRNTHPVETAKAAAVIVNGAMSALMKDSYPALKALLTHELVHNANQKIEEFHRLAGEIQRQIQGPMQVQQHQPGGYRPQHHPVGPNGHPYAGNMFQINPASSTNPMYATGTFMGGITKVAKGEGSEQAPTPHHTNHHDPRSPPVTSYIDSIANGARVPDHVVPELEPGPFDRVVDVASGAIIVPASRSDWKPTRSDEKPYRMAYNSETHCLFYGQLPDGTVEEVFVDWMKEGNLMDYLKHELDSDLRAAVPTDPNAPKIVPVFNMIERLKPISELELGSGTTVVLGELVESEPYPELKSKLPIEVNYFYGNIKPMISFGVVSMSLELSEAGGGRGIKCIEQYADIIDVCNGTEEEIAWYREIILPSDNISAILVELESPVSDVSEKLREKINVRLTDEINAALRYNLQISTKIDSAFEDYDDLMEMLNTTYGDSLLETWYANEPVLVKRALNVFCGERLDEFLKDEYDDRYDAAALEHIKKTLLVFADRIDMVFVDWASTDMNLAFKGSGALSAVSMPTLHAAVMSMFKRVETSEYPFAHHLLHMTDGVILQFNRGWLGKDFILMSKFQ